MLQSVHCAYCDLIFLRPIQRFNEAMKFGWKQYCSKKCQYEAKEKQVTFVCGRSGCNKSYKRTEYDFLRYGVTYCSHRCFALVSNKKHPRWSWKVKICAYCGKDFRRNRKYCSPTCQSKSQIISTDLLINQLKEFVRTEGRIPFKKELHHYSAVRRAFGTWNNFMRIAGFEPNPVLFAKKHIANDGHRCDSLAERIIDDWLFRRKIPHERSFPYPGNKSFTVDFKVENYWIEFFGLRGELKKYNESMDKKFKMARKYKLELISLYPVDLFPVGKLNEKLKFLL